MPKYCFTNELNEKNTIYKIIEENVGQNAELINKAFSRIINDNSKKQDKKEIKNKMNIDDNELETDLNKIKENNIDEGIKNEI